MIPSVVVLADYTGTLDVANRTEVRGRITEGFQQNPGIDVVDSPSARVRIANRDWEHSAGYTPFLIVPDLELGWQPQFLHAGDLATAWHDRHVRLGLAEFVTYGQQNSAFLPTVPTGPVGPGGATGPSGPSTPTGPTGPTGGPQTVQALAQPTTLRTGSSRTALATQLELSPRWSASGGVEYVLQGGLDTSSRLILPVLHGPRATANVGYATSRVDSLETRAYALRSDTSTGPCAASLLVPAASSATCAPQTALAQGTEAWRHHFTRTTEASLGVGASVVHARLRPSDPYADHAYPVVQVIVQHGRAVEAQRTIVRLDAQFAPLVDSLTGAADYRAQAAATVTLPIHFTTVRGSLAFSRSVESQFVQPLTFVTAGVQVDYRFTPWLTAGGGVLYAWQEQDTMGSFSTGMALVQATVHPTPLRF